MTITIQKAVPEQIEIEVPGYFITKPEFGSFITYTKVFSERQSLRITMFESGVFSVCNYESASEVIKVFSEGTPIPEAEFLKAVQECYTRFFLAAETSKDEAEEVTAFEGILT